MAEGGADLRCDLCNFTCAQWRGMTDHYLRWHNRRVTKHNCHNIPDPMDEEDTEFKELKAKLKKRQQNNTKYRNRERALEDLANAAAEAEAKNRAAQAKASLRGIVRFPQGTLRAQIYDRTAQE